MSARLTGGVGTDSSDGRLSTAPAAIRAPIGLPISLPILLAIRLAVHLAIGLPVLLPIGLAILLAIRTAIFLPGRIDDLRQDRGTDREGKGYDEC